MVVVSHSFGRVVLVLAVACLFGCGLTTLAESQGIQPSPYRATNVFGGDVFGALDLTPSNPLGIPGGAPQPPFLSSRMFQNILPLPNNLDLGFDYSFGTRIRTGRFWGDYLFPVHRSDSRLFFLEGHTEYVGFWQTNDQSSSGSQTISSSSVVGPITQTFRPYTATAPQTTTTASRFFSNFRDGFPNRFDLSLGGGCRWLMGETSFAGINAFFDTTRMHNQWYPSWGCGLETAGIMYGSALFDLTANLYGNQFDRNAFTDVWREAPGTGFDIEAGFSLPFVYATDLRLSVNGYGFNSGESIYGYRTAAELTSRNGLFTIRYGLGRDRHADTYHTIGGFINLAFQPENILAGESPFAAPEPVFSGPRNFRRVITRRVRRNWHQPSAAVVSRGQSGITTSATTTTLDCRRLHATRTFNTGLQFVPGGVFFILTVSFNEGDVPFDPNITTIDAEIVVTTNTITTAGGVPVQLGGTGAAVTLFPVPAFPDATTGTFYVDRQSPFGAIGDSTALIFTFPNSSGGDFQASGTVRFYQAAQCP